MRRLLVFLLAPIGVQCSIAAQPTGGSRGVRHRSPTCTVDPALLTGLTDDEASIASWLASDEMGQSHLLEGWESATVEDRRRLLDQVIAMDGRYPEDDRGLRGLAAYVAHARVLLADAAANENPFQGFEVEVPEGELMDIGSDSFKADEARGMAAMQDAVFVLVAGGLGERLGYAGIKVEMPTETLTCASFLETYITTLLAIERRGGTGTRPVPLVIMTSEDTHVKTLQLLEAHNYFGMQRDQLHIISQSNVPALCDNDARFAQADNDPFCLQTKPHGHGDVHTLLHRSGLLQRFIADQRTHLIFFQDTNVLAFKAIPAALGASIRNSLTMNSLTVPRSPGEAAGAICKLVRTGEPPLVINVEYNQLDAMLKANGKGSDTADSTGFSPYPGNVNTFILSLQPYATALSATGGSMPEFVNPKYANAQKTRFKKPTRLECMMQDFPKILGPEHSVGYTSFDRWFAFSPVKNSIAEALKADEMGIYAASPGAGEAAVFDANARLMRLAGVRMAPPAPPDVFLGLRLALFPAVALTPNFALTVNDVVSHLPGRDAITVTARSTLLLDGEVFLHSMHLDGALVIHAVPGATIHVRDCTIINDGWPLVAVEPDSEPVSVNIRGYAVDRSAGLEIAVRDPGEYELVGSGELRRLA